MNELAEKYQKLQKHQTRFRETCNELCKMRKLAAVATRKLIVAEVLFNLKVLWHAISMIK